MKRSCGIPRVIVNVIRIGIAKRNETNFSSSLKFNPISAEQFPFVGTQAHFRYKKMDLRFVGKKWWRRKPLSMLSSRVGDILKSEIVKSSTNSLHFDAPTCSAPYFCFKGGLSRRIWGVGYRQAMLFCKHTYAGLEPIKVFICLCIPSRWILSCRETYFSSWNLSCGNAVWNCRWKFSRLAQNFYSSYHLFTNIGFWLQILLKSLFRVNVAVDRERDYSGGMELPP